MRSRVKGTVYRKVTGTSRGLYWVCDMLDCGHHVTTQLRRWINATKRRCTRCEAKRRKERG